MEENWFWFCNDGLIASSNKEDVEQFITDLKKFPDILFRSQVLPRVRNCTRKRWNQDHSEGIHRENSEEVQHGECSCRDSNHQKLTEYWTREGREQISLSFCSWSIDVFNGRYKTRYCLCSWSCIKIFRESNRRWYCESQEDFQIPSRDSESGIKYQGSVKV